MFDLRPSFLFLEPFLFGGQTGSGGTTFRWAFDTIEQALREPLEGQITIPDL
jgi:hypothetical protein